MRCNCETCEAVRHVIQVATSGTQRDDTPYDSNLCFAFNILLDAMAVIRRTTWPSANSKELATDFGGITERYLAERLQELSQMKTYRHSSPEGRQ